MTLRVYGIKNCDTVKKARRWLEQHELPFEQMGAAFSESILRMIRGSRRP